MKKEISNSVAENLLIAKIAEEFVSALCLIEKFDDEIYTKSTAETGSIGAHFRHNFDFANEFLSGLEIGKIDYNKRIRDDRIEQDRQYAIEKITFLIRRLQNLPTKNLIQNILVRSEIEEKFWFASSIGRELEFLHSHTVHHHALINEKLRSSGVKTAFGFGVAPSTLRFWAEQGKGKTA
jgi:hypothetical protein